MALLCGQAVAAEHDDQESAQQQDGGQRAEPQNVKNHRSVASLSGVIVEAVQHELVHHIFANLALGSFDQTQLYVARKIFNAVVVLRQAAVGREQHDAAGVRKRLDLRLWVPGVTEADRVSQGVNLVLAASQEVPSFGAA